MAETEEIQQVTEDGDEKSAVGKTPAEEVNLFLGCKNKIVVCKPEEVIIQLSSVLTRLQLDQVFCLEYTLKKMLIN